jgi:CDP-diacylglycerol pyrophosphatase
MKAADRIEKRTQTMKRAAKLKSWIALAVILQFPASACAWTIDRQELWKIVNGMCVPDEQQHSNPAPCVEVNLSEGLDRGFVILKDGSPTKPNGYLLIPTRHIVDGDEDFFLRSGSPNYFQYAWNYRDFVSQHLGARLAWDMIGLATNSSHDRSQNQFHIHIDCVRPAVRDFLHGATEISDGLWSRVEVPTANHPYFVTKIPRDSLEGINPFKLVADGLPGAGVDIGLQTLVLIGARFQDGKRGFYLLTSRYDGPRSAHGEDLLDPGCQAAKSSD